MIQTYTIQELVPILKRRENTIRSYINNRELKASLLGNGYVITEEDVREFLHDQYVHKYNQEEEETDTEE